MRKAVALAAEVCSKYHIKDDNSPLKNVTKGSTLVWERAVLPLAAKRFHPDYAVKAKLFNSSHTILFCDSVQQHLPPPLLPPVLHSTRN